MGAVARVCKWEAVKGGAWCGRWARTGSRPERMYKCRRWRSTAGATGRVQVGRMERMGRDRRCA